MDFGPIASDDVGDHLVTIKNTNKEMPVDFTAPRIKFFKTTPSSGVIPAGQQVSVVVRYEPKNLGAHGERLAINALGVNGENHSDDDADREGGVSAGAVPRALIL